MLRHKKHAAEQAGSYLGSVLAWIGRIIGTFLLVMITTAAILAVIVAVYINKHLVKDIGINLRDMQLNLTSFVNAKDDSGNYVVLAQIMGAENRVWVDYKDIPQHLEHAVVSIEDKRFYEHHGVDWSTTVKGFLSLVGNSSTSGGSTVTQQVIKNLTGENQVTVQRKLREILMALDVEEKLNKKEIMELYLNTIYLSQGQYGIRAAAKYYFGKEVKDLTIAESACLVGITNLPSKYDPYLNPTKNEARRKTILGEMEAQGYITPAEYQQAMAEKLVFMKDKKGEETQTNTVQSTYVDQVFADVAADLQKELNISDKIAQASLYTAGYKIYACVDQKVQADMDSIFGDDAAYPGVRGLDKPQAAMTVVDPYTGAVLGMCGDRNAKTQARTFNRAVAKRPPGSSIKPLAVYAPAIDALGMTPYSPVLDAPVKLDSRGKIWPKNSTSTGYAGQMTMMHAVQISNNAGACNTLIAVTPEKSFEYMTKNFGFTTLVASKKSGKTILSDIDIAPLALGGLTYGVSTREMAGGYAAFVNKGVWNKTRTYDYVTDSNGKIILDNRDDAGTQAIKVNTAWYMNEMLVNVVTNGTGALAQLTNMPTAGKTGTTSNDHDRWWVGYSPYYVGAVWFGYDQPQEIKGVKNNPSVTMWKKVMDILHKGKERKEFFKIDKVVEARYCVDSGMAPGKACKSDARGSRIKTGRFAPEDVPKDACTIHQYVTICLFSGMRAGAGCTQTKTVAAMNLDRRFPMTGVILADEQYVARTGKGGSGNPPSNAARMSQRCNSKHTGTPVYSISPTATPTPTGTAVPTTKPSDKPPSSTPKPTQAPTPEPTPKKTQKPDPTPEPTPDVTPEPAP